MSLEEIGAGMSAAGMSAAGMSPAARLDRLLACAAVEPALDGILLLDCPPERLAGARERLEDLMAAVTGRAPARVTAGAHESEDDLWLGIAAGARDPDHLLVPGPLAPEDGSAVLVVVPDLPRLGPAGRRAATVLLGAPVAGLERHGRHRWWRPDVRWLAGCPSDELGGLSRHLLDRFVLKIPAGWPEDERDRVRRVLAACSRAGERARAGPAQDVGRPVPLPGFGAAALPGFEAEAADRVVLLHRPEASMRGLLALARLARALAVLKGVAAVGVEEVDEAAALTGRTVPAHTPRPPAPPSPPTASPSPPPGQPGPPVPLPEEPSGEIVSWPVAGSGEPLGLGPVEAAFPVPGAHADEGPGARQESTPLRPPPRRGREVRGRGGAVVGVDRATDLLDLAWVPTLMQAAMFQPVRRGGAARSGPGMILSPADLRAYRRMPGPDRLLALVLDHTCAAGWDLAGRLTPYLEWAYAARAAACVVEVGGAGAPSELRAERYVAHSVLDPRVPASLTRARGRATPLAHGLELARNAVQHALQHGWSPMSEALLVVVTDGLGNVPLEASMGGGAGGRWAGEGVRDAVEVAARIAELSRVRSVLLRPPLPLHPDLAQRLAATLGASMPGPDERRKPAGADERWGAR